MTLLYALIAHDRPNGLARRQEVRPEHLKHLDSLGSRLVLAGPFLDDNGDMTGSIVVIEAENLEAAQAIFNSDPFVVNGVFDQITIKRWHLGINNTNK
ncbi:MAG TPA: YciI family protein [Devosia sp.]|jgi:hypothetical protein|uniref:YciI family protein n=1 Tax=Devosia sp. TaxID=1871048 RepID=UPI002DDCB44B|nr:YciI family protein [Devosia sp.]HEV2517936.1 YciI family protein [Devosia sp.]